MVPLESTADYHVKNHKNEISSLDKVYSLDYDDKRHRLKEVEKKETSIRQNDVSKIKLC